jgi:hypothetical protein
MNVAVEAEPLKTRSGRWQVSLAGLIVLVLAAGVAAGLARQARDTWGVRMGPTRSSPYGPVMTASPVPIERTMGLLLEIAAVFMMMILAREILTIVRQQPGDGPSASGVRAWRVGWRVAAVALLVWFVSCDSNVLRYDFAGETEMASRSPGWGPNYLLRQGLLPVCAMMAMLGLPLGMGAGAILGDSSRERPRPYWLFVPLAAVVGLLIVAQPSWWSIIPYLVLHAIEAVKSAMPHRLVGGAGLSKRLLGASTGAAAAVVICLSFALLLARDFDRARRCEAWTATRAGRVVRLLLLVTTAAAGIYLAGVTIPAIQPCLAEGLFQILGRGEVFLILSGLGVFSTALAARSLTHPAQRPLPRWPAVVLASVRYAALGLVVASVLAMFPSSAELSTSLPSVLMRPVDVVQKAIARMFNALPDPFVAALFQWLALEQLLWYLMMIGLAILIVELGIRRDQAAFSPFDALAESKRVLIPALWLATALVVLCLAALPTLIVAGQVLVHLRINLADWMTWGWP